jgi:hypothetical protein
MNVYEDAKYANACVTSPSALATRIHFPKARVLIPHPPGGTCAEVTSQQHIDKYDSSKKQPIHLRSRHLERKENAEC